jgi:hypothetical protein
MVPSEIKKFEFIEHIERNSTVPTRSLETRERSLCKKPIFAAFPKIRFFTESIEIFFKSSHYGWLLPEFFSDFYN